MAIPTTSEEINRAVEAQSCAHTDIENDPSRITRIADLLTAEQLEEIFSRLASPSVIEGALPGLPEGSIAFVRELLEVLRSPVRGITRFEKAKPVQFVEYRKEAIDAITSKLDVALIVEPAVAALAAAASSPKGWEPTEAAKILRAYGRDNEATAHPWWGIVKKCGFGGQDLLCGPFFSRASAEQTLNARRHRYGQKAFVFCFSGGESHDFVALRAALPASPGEAQTNREN